MAIWKYIADADGTLQLLGAARHWYKHELMCVALAGGLLEDAWLVAGGWSVATPLETTDLVQYNPDNGRVEILPTGDMAVGRSAAAMCCLANGKVLAAGGQDASDVLASSEVWDEVTDGWTAGPATFPYAGGTANGRLVRSGSRVFLVGGLDGIAGSARADVLEYLVGSNTWETRASLPVARQAFSALELADGRILVAGGMAPTIFTDTTVIYDPDDDAWTAGPTMAGARSCPGMVHRSDGKVLIIGGTGYLGFEATAVDVFDPTTDTISAGPDLPIGVGLGLAFRITDDRIVVVNGSVPDSNPRLVLVLTNGAWEQHTDTHRGRQYGAYGVIRPLTAPQLFAVGGAGETGVSAPRDDGEFTIQLQSFTPLSVLTPAPIAFVPFAGSEAVPTQVDFGADVSTYPDLDASMVLNNDPALLSQAILRRFQTPRGSLAFHPDYGLDLRQFINETVTDELHYRLKAELEQEAEQDERVESALATVRFDAASETIELKLELETAEGPFELNLAVTQLAVALLDTSSPEAAT